MDKYDSFINKFKEIEGIVTKIPNAPSSANIKWYEDSIDDAEKRNKLYYCRIVRNYIQHNNDYKEFITITDGMINFLNEISVEISSKIYQAKDEMIPLSKINKATTKDKAIDTLKLMTKKKISLCPIIEDDIYVGMINIYELTDFVLENKTKTLKDYTKIKQKTGYKLIKESLPMEEVLNLKRDNSYIFCTDTGTSKGKIIGVIV